MRYENQTFTNSEVMLDDHEYVRCTLINCTLVTTGRPYALHETALKGETRVRFCNQSENTVMLLKLLLSNRQTRNAILQLLGLKTASPAT